MKHGYLIDMDGVIYKSGKLIPGADRFIRDLQQKDIPFIFVTNNSQRTCRDVMTNLSRIGIAVGEKHIYTCAMATARFLAKQKPNGTAYVIGEGGLLTALHTNGYSIVDRDPDYVVIGEGRTLNFEMVEKALGMVLGGAKLIATNVDPNCPTADGVRPGCGAIAAMLEAAAGLKAFSVGKPSPIIFRGACEVLGLHHNEAIVIGDTMETDILGGVQFDCRTVLVLSGGTRMKDMGHYAYRPDLIVKSLAQVTDESLLEMFDQDKRRPVGRIADALPHAVGA